MTLLANIMGLLRPIPYDDAKKLFNFSELKNFTFADINDVIIYQIRHHNSEFVKELINYANPTQNNFKFLIEMLIKKDDVTHFEIVVSKVEHPTNIRIDDRFTMLHIAARENSHNVIRHIIEKGYSDINNANCGYDGTPLHIAVFNDQIDAIKVLIDLGADRSFKNKEGKIPEDLTKISIIKEWIRSYNTDDAKVIQTFANLDDPKKELIKKFIEAISNN